jgi:hypothetical protein
MAKDQFQSPRQRMGRARLQLRDLVKLGKSFFNRAPHARVVEPDPDGVNHLHKIKLTRLIPAKMTSAAVEAIEKSPIRT